MTTTLLGTTWGHARAIDPLRASAVGFTRAHPEVAIEWRVRSLEDFEHGALGTAARSSDLLVIDHPMIGDIAAHGEFLDLAPLLEGEPRARRGEAWIGASLASYADGDALWAVPVDAATIHAAYRPDMLGTGPDAVPRTWSDVVDLGREVRKTGRYLGLAATGHHGFLLLASLMANAGSPLSQGDGPVRFHTSAFLAALESVRAILTLCHPASIGWNSIALHEAMIAADDIVYCPAVYGFATYGEALRRRRLAFAAFPGVAAPFEAGTALGGAGVAVTSACADPRIAASYLRYLIAPSTQLGVLAAHSGQPAAVEAWSDAPTDARFGGYFSAVRATLASAWTRPRTSSYSIFERRAGTLLQRHWEGTLTGPELARQIASLADSSSGCRCAPPFASR